MSEAVPGRVWRFGDNLDTDALAPGKYMKSDIATIASHCLEVLRPEFASQMRRGDIIVAGRNCGVGSSREQAPEALRHLGVAAVIAESFAGLFYRNALNLGLPVLVSAELAGIEDGAQLSVDPERGEMLLLPAGRRLRCEAIPAFLLEMVRAGGLVPHLERKLKKS